MITTSDIRAAMATAAVLATLATGALAGCGMAGSHGGRTHRTGPTAHQPPGQPRASADAYARRLLADLRLPGARRVPWPAKLPRSFEPLLAADLEVSVDPREMYRMADGMAAVNEYLTTHVPPGLVSDDSGQSGNVRLPAPTAYYVSYYPRHLPHGIYQATLGVAVVPARGGGSLLRVDAQVTWYPRRSAAEHVDPRRYNAVTVTAPRRYGSAHLVTRTFTARRIITRLARLVSGLSAMPHILMSCLEITAGSYSRLTFVPAQTRWPRIVVTMDGCGGAGVSVAGHGQPALDYWRSPLIATMDRLLGLPAPSR